jgi:hypothetical protein
LYAPSTDARGCAAGIIAGYTRADTDSGTPSSAGVRSQIARSLITQPIAEAAAMSVAVTARMPSQCTSAAVTRVWKASEARIAALDAAS